MRLQYKLINVEHTLQLAMEDSICPLEWRYGSNEMRKLFSREEILKTRIQVEIALLKALSKYGLVKEEDIQKVEKASLTIRPEEVDELESKIGHDVMAMVVLMAERSGDAGRYIHFGATSYDIVDTAYALIFRDAIRLVKKKVIEILEIMISLAIKYKDLVMVGRTHGQHALPITLGFKITNYIYEFSRSLERLNEVERRIVKGKMAGAVGTMAAWGNIGLEIEENVMKILGLRPHEISTQVAPRDAFAELTSDLSILASQCDRFALEVRELMRPEINEINEGVEGRVGSSTMPQKENPVTSEKIGGLAKVLRSLVVASLENIPLWHERDLTNSSSERIIISHEFLIIDEILDSMINLLRNLRINFENIERNLNLTKGQIMAESLMINLTLKGMKRHEAHQYVNKLTSKVRQTGKTLLEVCLEDSLILSYFSKQELENILNPKNYLGSYDKLIERTISYAKGIIKGSEI
ncbi:adenylosuccinate lyase [Sulfolobus sp. E5-1-F]|uniref:adenylosuccinate lyase n=1 Tax=Saccharolobus sp. E5-1-F TaxID=2663019 RepID=UPI0012956E84|nr:adenylosuccinate lyase [Sulfolobus sp. E5-1-F]QGA54958.1 adenylosuccinate lyase [Sulfolobus sp. E5-1-F]